MRILTSLLLCFMVTSSYCQQVEEGVLNGAKFHIIIPENWNGSLVMYAHGYEETNRYKELMGVEEVPEEEEEEEEDPFHEIFTGRGYAFAASEYRSQGLVVKEGIEDMEALRGYFERNYGVPESTIITGHSMGGMITIATIEKYPAEYDAALPLCGWLGPVHQLFKRGLDMLVTFDYLFGENSGELISGPLVPLATIEDFYDQGKKKYGNVFGEQFRLRGEDIPLVVFFTQGVLKETVEMRGGMPVGNSMTIYDGFGFEDEGLNQNVNRFSAIQRSQEHLLNYYTPSGEISDPVFALHTTYDELLPASNYEYYQERVLNAQNQDLYHQEYVVRSGHCFFTTSEVSSAFDRLMDWVQSGDKPEPIYK